MEVIFITVDESKRFQDSLNLGLPNLNKPVYWDSPDHLRTGKLILTNLN